MDLTKAFKFPVPAAAWTYLWVEVENAANSLVRYSLTDDLEVVVQAVVPFASKMRYSRTVSVMEFAEFLVNMDSEAARVVILSE